MPYLEAADTPSFEVNLWVYFGQIVRKIDKKQHLCIFFVGREGNREGKWFL